MKTRQFIILCLLVVIGFCVLGIQNYKLHKQTSGWCEGTMITTTDQYGRIMNNVSKIREKLGM